MDIIDCDTESCLNNGTCIELVNGFACQCLPNLYGPRCEYHRTVNSNNYCTTKCLNNGKCVVINSREQCLCQAKYYGSACEYQRSNHQNSLSSISRCSLLTFRNNHREGKCLAIGLIRLFNIYCECHYENKNENFVNCQITPSPFASMM